MFSTTYALSNSCSHGVKSKPPHAHQDGPFKSLESFQLPRIACVGNALGLGAQRHDYGVTYCESYKHVLVKYTYLHR